jgi:hypothetical protein
LPAYEPARLPDRFCLRRTDFSSPHRAEYAIIGYIRRRLGAVLLDHPDK